MATIRLVPSAYYLSNSSYLSVSNASNMYHNTDNTSYATVTNSRASTTSYYIYLRGFNFDDVPSAAVVSSITIKLKAYHSGGNTSTIYCYDNTTQVSSAGSASALTTSATVRTFSNTTIDWDTLKSYGSDFGIRINCRRRSKNTTSYIYIYGAEIEVEYTLPVFYNINVTNNTSGTVSPIGATSVLENDDFTVMISNVSSPIVTDNGNNVTSQLVKLTSQTSTFIPYDYTSSGFTISNINNAYSNISDSNYADCSLAARTTGELYLDLGPINIPSNATISDISCQASLQISRNGSSSGMTAECQMYSGNTAKGSATTLVSSATDVARTTYTLNIGSWTATELQNAKFYLTMYNGASGTVRHIYVYGISFNISYTVNGDVYTYTISNVQGSHTIVVNVGAGPTQKIFFKNNGTWVQYSKVYIKQNGTWVEQSPSNWSSVFDTTKNYVKG